MEKLVLIDGNSLLNRAFYATPLFTTQSGAPTNAIFGFTKLLFKILDDVKPEYIVVAFDLKAKTFRHNMYDGYKATRKPMPEELAAQVGPLKSLLSAMKIATCEKEGIEADDILGTLSKKFGVHSYIYTGDRDSYQLVDEKTDVCFTKQGVSDILHLDLGNFKEITGLNPPQIVDLKALKGDKSDNIPGVPGIGDKTAADLLAKYGNLDGVYQNLDELRASVKEKLLKGKELAYLSYELATIKRDCDVDIALENCRAPERYDSTVKKLFADLEFKSFLSLDIFEESKGEPSKTQYPNRVVCRERVDFEGEFLKTNLFSAVLERDFCNIYANGCEYVIKFTVKLGDEGLSGDDCVYALNLVFANKDNTVITYDFKKCMHDLEEFGVEAQCDFEDVALGRYLSERKTAGVSVKELCDYYLYDYDFCAFCMEKLFESYRETLKNDGLYSLYAEIEKPLVKILYEMEKTGVLVSTERLTALTQKFKALEEEYRFKIYRQCETEFNLNSPAKLGEVLYEKFGLKEVKNSKGKYTTSAEVLEKLQKKAPVVADILKYRMYQKLLSTYCDGMRTLIERRSGLVHTTYNQILTATGRLSSSNPNLQNIPIREDEGRELRKIFVPHEGCVFIDADYSQIELRLLAHFSGCEELIKAYNDGVDIHSVTASQVFGVSMSEVTPQMRREAKAVNFGIIYGISDFGLAKNLNISVPKAREYIEKYFSTYSAVKEYMDKNVEFARAHGYVCTLTGRKRVIPEINSSNYYLRQFGERAAMNMPLQGSSADIIKIAMINVYKALKEGGLKSKLILQVHDELVLESPEEEMETASKILKDGMEKAVNLKVPLIVELHTGKDWYEAK